MEHATPNRWHQNLKQIAMVHNIICPSVSSNNLLSLALANWTMQGDSVTPRLMSARLLGLVGGGIRHDSLYYKTQNLYVLIRFSSRAWVSQQMVVEHCSLSMYRPYSRCIGVQQAVSVETLTLVRSLTSIGLPLIVYNGERPILYNLSTEPIQVSGIDYSKNLYIYPQPQTLQNSLSVIA